MYRLHNIRNLANEDLFFLLILHFIGSKIMLYNKFIGGIMCVSIVFLIVRLFFRNRTGIVFPLTMKVLVTIYLFLDITCVIIQSYFRGVPQWGNEWLNFMTYHFVSAYDYLAFIVPFIVCYNRQKFNLSFLCKFGGLIAFMSICLVIVFYKEIINDSLGLSENLSFNGEDFVGLFSSCSFLLLLTPYIKRKMNSFIIFLFGIITLFTTIVFARRGSSLSVTIILLISLFYFLKKISFIKKILVFTFIGGVLLISSPHLFSSDIFYNLKEKGLYDSRSEVSDYFKKDMFNSKDLYFGRGMNGRYYCPQVYQTESGIDTVKYRYGIETGFYQLILRGGLIFALLHVSILAISAFKGLFFSRNNVLKAFSLWIILSLWELYPFGWPTFSIKFLLIWMGVSLCNNKEYLKMNDTQICKQLKIS